MPKKTDDAILVFVDLGNWGLKTVVVHPSGDIQTLLVPHDFVYMTETQFKNAEARNKYQAHRVELSSTLKKIYKNGDEVFAIVGKEAEKDRSSNKRIGSAKYVMGYFDVLLVAVLMQLFPNGHENIILGVGYPPSELAQVPNLVDTLLGVHKCFGLDGNEKKYIVRAVIPVDEPIGSLEWYAHNNGQYNPISINPGDRFILIDIGGSIGSIGRVLVNSDGTFAPLYQDFLPINNGVNDVYRQLHGHLKDMYPALFNTRQIPNEILREALTNRKVVLSGGKPISVEEAVIQSLSIIDDVESKFLNDFDGGKYDRGVLLTGGSMRDLYHEFQTVLNHQNVEPVCQVSEIIMANIRGIMLIVVARLIADGKLPSNYRGVFDGYFKTR